MRKLIFLFCLFISIHARADESNFEDYTIGAGDTVNISVYKSPDLKLSARVSGAGTVNFPLIGEIKIDGLTTREAENLVSNKLTSNRYLVSPQVSVAVTEYQSKMFTILGYIQKPGKYSLDMPLRLTEAIAIAGGNEVLASDTISITSTKEGGVEKRYFNLRTMLDSNGDEVIENPRIRPNDIIYVPKYPVFYIYGEVKAPGAYKIEQNMRVSQALATGGGLTLRGSKKDLSIIRLNADGKVVNTPASLDDFVRPDDVIDIKESLF